MSLSSLPSFDLNLPTTQLSSDTHFPTQKRIDRNSNKVELYSSEPLEGNLNHFKVKVCNSFYSFNLNQRRAIQNTFYSIYNFCCPCLQTFSIEQKSRLDDFVFIKVLGKGFFAKVHQSLHKPSGDHFAIKEINLKKVIKLDKLIRAIRLSFILQHSFILKNHCFLYVKNQDTIQKKFVMMEHLSGVEAYNYLDHRESFSLDETRFFISSLLLAIKYLHDQSIVHRDLKLENIFITTDGYLKLLDFDFIKNLTESDGRTSTKCGSPDYNAPEIIRGFKNYKGTCVDMWSVGVITYICLCKKMPFNKTSTIYTLALEIVGEEPDYTFFQFKGNQWIIAQDFIQQLLEKKPCDRMSVDEALAHPF